VSVGSGGGAVVVVLDDHSLLAGESAGKDHHHLSGLRRRKERGGKRGREETSECLPERIAYDAVCACATHCSPTCLHLVSAELMVQDRRGKVGRRPGQD